MQREAGRLPVTIGAIESGFSFSYHATQRPLMAMLNRWGHAVNDKRVPRLIRVMGLEAIYPKPRTSLKNQANPVYPYLLTGLAIDRPDQVWATDITYIPLQRSWVCGCGDGLVLPLQRMVGYARRP